MSLLAVGGNTSQARFRCCTVIALLVALAFSTFALASCSGEDQRSLSWDAYNAEYLRETAELQLPSGYCWPSCAPGPKSTDGLPDTYEKGCGCSDAEGYWFAAWSQHWLDTRESDGAAARDALAHMAQITDTYKYRVCNDASGQQWYDDMIRRAKLGDPSLIRQYLVANGPAFARDSGTSTPGATR